MANVSKSTVGSFFVKANDLKKFSETSCLVICARLGFTYDEFCNVAGLDQSKDYIPTLSPQAYKLLKAKSTNKANQAMATALIHYHSALVSVNDAVKAYEEYQRHSEVAAWSILSTAQYEAGVGSGYMRTDWEEVDKKLKSNSEVIAKARAARHEPTIKMRDEANRLYKAGNFKSKKYASVELVTLMIAFGKKKDVGFKFKAEYDNINETIYGWLLYPDGKPEKGN